ncbi:MAG TPA: NUDIX hydrolase [Tepidisphaeraceae bacterium]|jgi:ADP-ribose pyrophosphatase|nr:NUDIX hydrolase [Tepidisphaeraceae bacterium]
MPTEILCDAKYLRLIRDNGWEFVQRKNVTGIVGIIALTSDRKLILVEQYRPPVGKNVIEIPAGLAGDTANSKNEDLRFAASRELEEETGYRAARMTLLATGTASAGLCDEIITLFRAEDLEKVNDGGGDDGEDITVHEIPLDHVEHWLKKQTAQNKLVDLKVYSALHFAR